MGLQSQARLSMQAVTSQGDHTHAYSIAETVTFQSDLPPCTPTPQSEHEENIGHIPVVGCSIKYLNAFLQNYQRPSVGV